MTNPDRDELVKLADFWERKAEFNRKMLHPSDRTKADDYVEETAKLFRRLASSGGVKVKPLVWRDHRPDSFPEPAWSAQTSFGFYNIEEVSASDSPAYVVRLHAHHFVADKDSLDEAKAAAQADYEARIKSALVGVPAVKGEPLAWADKYGETHPITAESKKTLSNNPTTEPYWSRFSIPLYAAPPADAGMREEVGWLIEMSDPPVYHRVTDDHDVYWTTDASKALRFARRDDAQAYSDHIGWTSPPVRIVEHMWPALTAPGATTKSDGGVFKAATDVCHVWRNNAANTNFRMVKALIEPVAALERALASQETQFNEVGPSDPSSTRSDVTALADIAKERQRQRDIEGWTVAHDDGHDAGEMASAAACYALSATGIRGDDGAMLRFWPWDDHWWKPTNRRRDLIKAGALIVAEIERLDRLDQFEIRRKK